MFVIILFTLILIMPKNISISFSGIIILWNLLNRLNRNTASRVISLFKMSILFDDRSSLENLVKSSF